MRKLLSIVLTMMLVLGLVGTAMAETPATTAGHGSITIQNAVSGHTYTAYQIFAGDWDSQTEKLSNIKWGNGISTAGQTALYSAYSLTADADKTAEKVAEAIPNNDAGAQAFANNIGETTNLGTGSTGSFSGTNYVISDLTDGYYMIVDTYTPADNEKDIYYARYMIQKVGNATLNNKADKPTVEKKIDEDNNLSTTNDRVDGNTANIGDTVTYVITSRVPDMTGYKEYYMDFSDVLSKGLTYDADSLKVTIGGTELAKDTAYTLTVGNYSATDGTSIAVHLKDLVSRSYAKGAVIEITYTAKVNDAAVIGDAGNPNKVKLDYSNNPRNSGDGTPDNNDDGVKGETPWDEVKTFVTEIELVKVNSDSTKLAGAVFNIKASQINKVIIKGEKFEESDSGTYYLLNDGTYTTKAPTDATRSQYKNDTQKYAKASYETTSVQETADTAFQVVSGSDGVVRLTGLKEGTYTITEIQAPDGYNLLTGNIVVVVTSNIEDAKDGSPAFAWSATKDGTALTQTENKFTFQVENKSGATLPATGGIGTGIFYAVGGLLAVAAGVLLVTKRRVNATK